MSALPSWYFDLSVCWVGNSLLDDHLLSPTSYQAPVKRASWCGNEGQGRSGRRKAGRKGRGEKTHRGDKSVAMDVMKIV